LNHLNINADGFTPSDDTSDASLRMRKAEMNRPWDCARRYERPAITVRRKAPVCWFDFGFEAGKRGAQKSVCKNVPPSMAFQDKTLGALLFR